MSTITLDNRTEKRLQPAHGLWKLYRPGKAPFRFAARTAAEAARWQRRTRPALEAALGFTALAPAPLRARRIERVDRGDFVREKYLLQVWRDSVMPVYLLVPRRRTRPLPVVVAFNGHGYGVKDIVGLWEDGSERMTPDGYHKDFAIELCRRGFAVAAPEISCFGERQTDFSYLDAVLGQGRPTTCTHAAMLAFHLGGSVIGLRAFEGRRLVDWLETRPGLDAGRLGAMGISGGGMHTFFSTCLDERIRACVVSGYFCTFRDSVLAMHHCPCNFAPGLHRFGEMHDLAALIAPRPMLVEAANRDPIFPIGAVEASVARARRAYSLFGCRDALATDYFEGRHQISGRLAYDFLARHLGLGARGG